MDIGYASGDLRRPAPEQLVVAHALVADAASYRVLAMLLDREVNGQDLLRAGARSRHAHHDAKPAEAMVKRLKAVLSPSSVKMRRWPTATRTSAEHRTLGREPRQRALRRSRAAFAGTAAQHRDGDELGASVAQVEQPKRDAYRGLLRLLDEAVPRCRMSGAEVLALVHRDAGSSLKAYAMLRIDHAMAFALARRWRRAALRSAASASACGTACGMDSRRLSRCSSTRAMAKVATGSYLPRCAHRASLPRLMSRPSTSGLRPSKAATVGDAGSLFPGNRIRRECLRHVTRR